MQCYASMKTCAALAAGKHSHAAHTSGGVRMTKAWGRRASHYPSSLSRSAHPAVAHEETSSQQLTLLLHHGNAENHAPRA